jgi:hypothetical protein
VNAGEPTVESVRAYLLAQANGALQRPSMYGGEVTIRLYLDAVAVACGAERAWAAGMDDLRARGGFNAAGVSGALTTVLGSATDDAVASVYADVAHRCGWLHLDHCLSAEDYDAMAGAVAAICRADIGWSRLRERFGEPSVLFGGTNPRYPKTLGYAGPRSGDPLICFHLWNTGDAHDSHSEPVLLAVRRTDPATAFGDGFTVTPAGRARLTGRPPRTRNSPVPGPAGMPDHRNG